MKYLEVTDTVFRILQSLSFAKVLIGERRAL